VLGGLEVLSIALGDRLGLYRALAQEPGSPDELAERLRLSPRWTREWLEQHAVAGYLEVVGDRFSLAPGVAETLARPDALTTLAPLSRIVAATGLQLDEIEAAARTGLGHPWGSYGHEMRDGQAMINKPALLHDLPLAWLPAALPEVCERLASGESLRAADIGCGGAWSAIGLARHFPTLRVDGYDVDPASVALAHHNVEAQGLGDRVSILDTDLSRGPRVVRLRDRDGVRARPARSGGCAGRRTSGPGTRRTPPGDRREGGRDVHRPWRRGGAADVRLQHPDLPDRQHVHARLRGDRHGDAPPNHVSLCRRSGLQPRP